MDPSIAFQTRCTPLCSRCNAALQMRERKCPPTIQCKLRSMHLPSETEAAQINQIVLDIDGDLERCEAEISSLNRVLVDLGKRKKHLQSIRDNYRALLAPVRKLPVEILLEIFSYACVQNPSLSITSANYEDKLSMPTLHIAKTCSQWRKIALSNPGLWSNITVDLAQRSWNVRDLVKLYLHRSGSTLLTLSIKAFRLHRDTPDCSAYHLQELGRESWELLGLLLKETSRWSRVSFDLAMNIYEDVNYVVHNEGVDTMPSLYSLPNLTHLEFEWDDWSGDDDNIPSFFFKFSSALSLRKIRIPVLHNIFHLDQLVEVELQYQSLPQMDMLIRQCCRLKALTLSISFRDSETHDLPLQDIESDSLESITLSFDCHYSQILPLLVLPNLKSLTLHVNDEGQAVQTTFTEHLEIMLDKSPSLIEFRVHGPLISNHALINILTSMPRLQRLALFITYDYYQAFKSKFFRALHAKHPSPLGVPLLPDLIHLEIHLKEHRLYWEEAEIDSRLIVSMLESRRDTLQHFEMHTEPRTPSAYEWSKGLYYTVSYWHKLSGFGTKGLRLTLSSTKGHWRTVI